MGAGEKLTVLSHSLQQELRIHKLDAIAAGTIRLIHMMKPF